MLRNKSWDGKCGDSCTPFSNGWVSLHHNVQPGEDVARHDNSLGTNLDPGEHADKYHYHQKI